MKRRNKEIKKYIFLITLIIIGIIFGIVFSLVLSKSDKLIVTNTINSYFTNKNINKSIMIDNFKQSIVSNLFYLGLVWILGMSIIGIPIILFMLFGKGFILGFSIGSILRIYHLKGIIGVICYIFPHHILSLILSILLTYHSTNMSIKLFKYLFLKKEMNVKKVMKKYLNILIICGVGYIICSFSESFISFKIIKLFSKIIN